MRNYHTFNALGTVRNRELLGDSASLQYSNTPILHHSNTLAFKKDFTSFEMTQH